MKVRLLNLAAIAAVATGSSVLAQQGGDELQRALADLNNDVVAPAQGGVSAPQSSSLQISGDSRVRNTWHNPSGMANDQKNVDARLLVNFAFQVNESATAFVQLNAHENWGNTLPVVGTGSGGNTVVTGLMAGSRNQATGELANLETLAIRQAYFTAEDVFGDGGTFKVGRSDFTFGSGRIIGTDYWDQNPASYSGVWYNHGFEGVNLDAFMVSDSISAGGANFQSGTVPGDVDLFGVRLGFVLEELPFLGNVELSPYWLRNSPQNNAPALANWFGAEASGSFEDAIDWNGEIVFLDSNAPGAPSMSDSNAWAIDVDINLGEWVSDLPGDLDPTLQVGIAAADPTGITINPLYHNTAGLYDVSNRTPLGGAPTGAGGVWNGLADTWQVGLGFHPMEGWNGRVTWVNFNDQTGTGAYDATELDVTLDTVLGSGVLGSLGWGWVDWDNLTKDAYIVYATVGLPF